MRLILFQFYTFETALTLLLIYFHIHGFLEYLEYLPFSVQIYHYFYSAGFYLFGVLTMFASINICTGYNISLNKEVGRTICGSLLHTLISLLTLKESEEDFHLMYIMGEWKLEVEKPVHPFLKYLRSQAICSMICGVAYALHAIIVIDVILSSQDSVSIMYDENEVYDDSAYIPVRLYVFGEPVQARLDKMDWAVDFETGAMQPI